MDFVTAIKLSRWVRRKAWPHWIHVSDTAVRALGASHDLAYLDLIAGDWVAYHFRDEQPPDDSAIRFTLIELE